MPTFQLITINDREETCNCCGKQGLAKVAWLLNTDTNEENHYGVVCASKLLSKKDGKELKNLSLKSALVFKALENLKSLECNISEWFDAFQSFCRVHIYETKLIPTNILKIKYYLGEVIGYDGKSLSHPIMKSRFNELVFIDFNDLLTEVLNFSKK